jgi:hypothetical protein
MPATRNVALKNGVHSKNAQLPYRRKNPKSYKSISRKFPLTDFQSRKRTLTTSLARYIYVSAAFEVVTELRRDRPGVFNATTYPRCYLDAFDA